MVVAVGAGLGVGVAAVEAVVAAGLHLVIEQVEAEVGTEHVGAGDTTAEAAHAAAHHAAAHAAHHTAHAATAEAHAAGAVVAVTDDEDLGTVGEVAKEEVALVAVVVIIGERGDVVGGIGGRGGRDVVADTRGDVGHETAHGTAYDGEVEDSLLLAVIDAGELCLVGLLLDYLDLLDELGRNVLGSDLGIVHEEGLAFHVHLGDSLSVDDDGAVIVDLDTGKLLQEVLEDIVLGGLEGSCVIFDSIFLDGDRGAHVGDAGGLEHLAVKLELDIADGNVLTLDGDFLLIFEVTHHLGSEYIGAVLDAGEGSGTLFSGKGVFGGIGRSLGGYGNCCVADRLIVGCVDKGDAH